MPSRLATSFSSKCAVEVARCKPALLGARSVLGEGRRECLHFLGADDVCFFEEQTME
jgi:hypothetical protein